MNIQQMIDWKSIDFMNTIPVITTKVNSGKTTYAVKQLRDDLEKERARRTLETISRNDDQYEHFREEVLTNPCYKYVFLLTPYKNTKDQILARADFVHDVTDIYSFPQTDLVTTEDAEHVNPVVPHVMVTTYSGFAKLVSKTFVPPEQTLLIIDELHTFAQWACWQEQLGSILVYLDVAYGQGLTVIGMTGTPEILFEHYNGSPYCKFQFVDVTPQSDETLTANNGLFVKNGSAISYMRARNREGYKHKILVYVSTPKTAYAIVQDCKANGINACFTCSQYNDEICEETGRTWAEEMNAQRFKGLSISDYLNQYAEFPPNVQVLVINSASRDGLNIIDQYQNVQEIVIQSECLMTIRQARGRIRHDVEQIVVIYNKENEHNAIKSFSDVFQFFARFSTLETQEAKQLMLSKRWVDQSNRFNLHKQWKQNRALAHEKNEQFFEPEPPVLDIVSIYDWINSRFFVNPFICGKVEFELENFQHSTEERTYYDGGLEIMEKNELFKGGKYIPTLSQFIVQLEILLNNKEFIVISGRDICRNVRNYSNTTLDKIMQALGLPYGFDDYVLADDLREACKTLKIVTKDGHRAGNKTLIAELKRQGITDGVQKRLTRNGVKKTYYKITIPAIDELEQF